MTLSLFKPFKGKKELLSDKKIFFDALGRVESPAVKLLADKIGYDTSKAVRQAQLSPEDAEEVINGAVLITVANIKKGQFQYADFSPVAYAKGVVRKLIANRLRSKRPKQEELSQVTAASDFDPDKYLRDKERQTIVGKLLGRLGENCRQLLEMKYFKQLKDSEIMEQKLSPYSSIGSLKSKRSQCLKEMATQAREAGIKHVLNLFG